MLMCEVDGFAVRQAIERDVNNAVFFHNRGFTYRNMGSFEKAIEDYTRAIELNPKNAAAYNNRGYARRKLGQYNLAIEGTWTAIYHV